MVTTIGTESRLEDLLADLLQLEHDAAGAYEAAMERLESIEFRTQLGSFKSDHLRHIDELRDLLTSMGHTPPEKGDLKGYLAKGKVVIGGLMGDEAILQAMRTNEDDTNTAYERAIHFRDAPPSAKDVLQRAREDERRHCAWIVSTLEKM